MSLAFSIERKLENTRSWNRCSWASSNNSMRTTSLESGAMLWRLNHELLPEPGRPMARITAPFGGRAGALGTTFVGSGSAAAFGVGGSVVSAGGDPAAPDL